MSTFRMQRRSFLEAAGAAALAAALPRSARAQADAPLRLGYGTTSWGAVGMIAEAEKTFAKAGANVQVFHFADGKSTRDAMISGRVDIGVVGGTPFIIGAAKGDMGALGTAMYAGKTNGIVVAKDGPFKSVADLKGKRIASQLGSSTHYVLINKILPKYGMAPTDVQIVNVSFQNQVSALVGKSADAFAGVEPFLSVAEVESLGTVLVDYGEFDMQPVFIAVNEPVLKTKHDALVAFMHGWLDAVDILKHQPDRAAKIIWETFRQQGYDTKEPVFRRMLAKLDIDPAYVSGLPAYLDEQADVLVKQKQIAAVPQWGRILDAGILGEARKA